ncbi:MAG: hypothetical protein WA628_15025 [Terriglobales bacterium]
MELSKAVFAIGSLGTAAYGVVDATKAFGGGISNRGFDDIRKVVSKFIPASAGDSDGASALSLQSALATLRANWLNGMALSDQKAIAKALIKLNLTRPSASGMAVATGVDANVLMGISDKLATGEALTQKETDVFGRFDLLLNALLDQGYQRADQRYRNSAKLLAIPVAVVLALLGARVVYGDGFTSADILWKALIGGLLATPLAPIAKDLSSAIQAGTKVTQSWKK